MDRTAGKIDISVQRTGSGASELFAIRHVTGLVVLEEALVQSRFVVRGWSSDGLITPEMHLRDHLSARLQTLPINSFAIEIDGQSLHNQWRWKDVQIVPSDDIKRARSYVELEHLTRPVTVRVWTELDGTPIVTRWLEIINTSSNPAALSLAAPWSGPLWTKKFFPYDLINKPEKIFKLGWFQSSVSHWEGDFNWQDLTHGTFRIEGRRGHSGYGSPFFMVSNELDGTTFIGSLAWSGNWQFDFLCDQEPHGDEANLILRAGPAGVAPQRVLAPGERIESPKMHLGHIHGGLNDAVQAMHEHVRRSIVPKPPVGRDLLVQYDTLNEGGGYFIEKSDYYGELKRQVDTAADLGSEVFIIDSGWYGKAATRGTFGIAGDWHPNEYLPEGLAIVREYASKRGLLFGLYAEIEALGFDSDLFRTHPEWALTRDGRILHGYERDKRGLINLCIPEAAKWLEEEIARIITEYKLDLFRLDANVRLIYEGGENSVSGYVENSLWRYYENLYAIFGRLRARFPEVIFQQSSSGGCRSDLGIMEHFHEAFLTDGTHMPRQLHALNGLSLLFPPELFVLAVGIVWPPDAPRGQIETQLRLQCVLSHPWIADIGVRTPYSGDSADVRFPLFREYIEFYKSVVRPIQRESLVYHHSPITERDAAGDWMELEIGTPDRSESVAVIVRLESDCDDAKHFIPRGLRWDLDYQVYFGNEKVTRKISGSELMDRGVRIRIGSKFSSQLLHFRAA